MSAVRLLRLRTSDRAVLTDETYGAAGTFYYYPAVTVDSLGTIFLGFDRSSATEYPSSYGTGRRRVDAALQSSALLKAGQTSTAQSRWGDYTGIDMDAAQCTPAGSVAWYAGQWTIGTNTFGAWVTPLTFTYGRIAGVVNQDCDGLAATTADRTPLAGVTVIGESRVAIAAIRIGRVPGMQARTIARPERSAGPPRFDIGRVPRNAFALRGGGDRDAVTRFHGGCMGGRERERRCRRRHP